MNSFPVETRDICGLYRMRWKGSLCADIDNAGLVSCSFFSHKLQLQPLVKLCKILESAKLLSLGEIEVKTIFNLLPKTKIR